MPLCCQQVGSSSSSPCLHLMAYAAGEMPNSLEAFPFPSVLLYKDKYQSYKNIMSCKHGSLDGERLTSSGKDEIAHYILQTTCLKCTDSRITEHEQGAHQIGKNSLRTSESFKSF